MILVFGGNGQLGRALRARAQARRTTLTSLPHSGADVADPGSIVRAIAEVRPTLVVNAAAYTGVDKAESEPEAARRANAVGPAVVAEACAARGVPLVHISTDYVFDGGKRLPYRESDRVAPLGVYGQTKAEGEAAVRRLQPQHVILRTAWLYGPDGHNFLKTIMRLALERDELRVVADQRGSPTAAVDLADAIFRIAPVLADNRAPWGTYHLAGSGATTWHGFAERIVAAQEPLTGRRPKVTPIATADYPTAAERPQNSVLDCWRFARTFGLRPRHWEQAVDATVTSLLALEAAAA